MFGPRLTFLKVFGIPLRVDLSWLFIAVLITWSLGAHYFPIQHEGLETSTYWIMGFMGAMGLFLSILLHELGHAVTAQRYGMRIKGITLFIFGGVAELQDEPPSPIAEFAVAIAGPVVTLVIMVACFFGAWAGGAMEAPVAITAVVAYLAFINGLLLVFNMIPAFPLDGGRVLRSALWAWKDDLRWATRFTSRLGGAFGIFLIALAVLSLLTGQIVAAVWWFLIGMFLRGAAGMSYQQLMMRQALEGEPISRFMSTDPVVVDPGMPIDRFVEDVVYRTHHKLYPVLESDGRLLGCITTRDVKETPREQWTSRTVGDAMTTCNGENTISPDEDAMKALSRMNGSQASRLMVVEGDRLVGVIALKDLLGFLNLKIELEEQ
ncbi:MAG: site-2 protease family protein [Phycisphaeraceae bacterium]|nr:MAG: site-2 protease family protein [Phycisphaeraceae bacterium]